MEVADNPVKTRIHLLLFSFSGMEWSPHLVGMDLVFEHTAVFHKYI